MTTAEASSGSPAWMSRAFAFDLDPALAPLVVVRLAGVPPRLDELLRGASPGALRRKPEGKWSAQEHAGHLADLEALGERRLDEYLAGVPVLSPADMQNAATHGADHNARATGDVLADVRRRRLAFVRRLDGLAPKDFARRARHPRLQREMKLIDLLAFIAEHDDHHLACVAALLRAAPAAS
jgi:uncharacterized damage-inducible protein DinB